MKKARGKGGYARGMKRRHAIRRHTRASDIKHPIAIIIPTLDKTKGDETGASALAQAGCSVPVRVIVAHDQHKHGFTRTANDGIRRANPNEDVCLLNDDTDGFQPGWLETLRTVLYSDPNYGLSCPSGASAAAPMNRGRPGQTGTQVVKQVSFWCVLMKRSMLNDLGLLDESFIHYCSDNWYCLRMRRTSWKCVWAKAVYLGHRRHGSGTQDDWKLHDRAIWLKRVK